MPMAKPALSEAGRAMTRTALGLWLVGDGTTPRGVITPLCSGDEGISHIAPIVLLEAGRITSFPPKRSAQSSAEGRTTFVWGDTPPSPEARATGSKAPTVLPREDGRMPFTRAPSSGRIRPTPTLPLRRQISSRSGPPAESFFTRIQPPTLESLCRPAAALGPR